MSRTHVRGGDLTRRFASKVGTLLARLISQPPGSELLRSLQMPDIAKDLILRLPDIVQARLGGGRGTGIRDR